MKLGKIKQIKDLRTIWKHEAHDFTKWLAKEENLNQLGNETGIDIELITTEAKTGSFSTDILAIESNTDNKIIIENQLETTDHDHLGKLLTYASGHDAKTIIWIVKEIREEHRQAIDWLNEHTDNEVNIFLIKIELWKIGNSPIAPKFQIVSSPNNWTKTIKRSTNNEISENKMKYLNFWNKMKNEKSNDYTNLNFNKPRAQMWYNIPFGSSLAHISLTASTQKKRIISQIYIGDKKSKRDEYKALYDYLFNQKEEIEKELGFKLNWNRLNDKIACTINIIKEIDINDENNWDEAIEWLLNKADKLNNAFAKRIKQYKRS